MNMNYDEKYDIIKKQLKQINKTLSRSFDEKMKNKIEELKKLTTELDEISSKVNLYTKTIIKEKIPTIDNRPISIQDMDDLLTQMEETKHKHLKKLVTITTAFGKMKYVIDIEDIEKNKKEIYFNL